jgi:hypothetical protein
MSAMYLGVYEFDGDPDVLLAGYERLAQQFPLDTLDIHLCVRREDGISVYDACPSKADFDNFSATEQFRAAVYAAGLPQPRIGGAGTVQVAHVKHTVR